MVSIILFVAWCILGFLMWVIAMGRDSVRTWIFSIVLLLITVLPCVITIFTGVHVSNGEGQYKGYVTSVEQNGAIFKGWNAYLKTSLESSDADLACIDRTNQKLIDNLKAAQAEKRNVTVKYRSVWQFALGECPYTDWMVHELIQ